MNKVEKKVEHISYEHYLFMKRLPWSTQKDVSETVVVELDGLKEIEYLVEAPTEHGSPCIQLEDAHLFTEEELMNCWGTVCDYQNEGMEERQAYIKNHDWNNHKKESVRNVN